MKQSDLWYLGFMFFGSCLMIWGHGDTKWTGLAAVVILVLISLWIRDHENNIWCTQNGGHMIYGNYSANCVFPPK